MLRTLCAALLAAAAPWGHSAPPATVADLAWMTGAWAGSIGAGQTLEEHWLEPADGTVAAVVRLTGDGVTSMVEFIVIRETDASLAMRIQQWNADFSPRTAPQTFALSAIGERRVAWRADGEGPMRALTYARPQPDRFTIDVELADGSALHAELQAR